MRELDESRARRPLDRKSDEAKAILAALTPGAELSRCDEGGELLGSRDFSAYLGRRRDAGVSAVALVVGGADGLANVIRDRAQLILSLGPMTFPHQLVRIMVAEQIYQGRDDPCRSSLSSGLARRG